MKTQIAKNSAPKKASKIAAPLAALKHHVSGAIARGEAKAIEEKIGSIRGPFITRKKKGVNQVYYVINRGIEETAHFIFGELNTEVETMREAEVFAKELVA